MELIAVGGGAVAVTHRPRLKSLPTMRLAGTTHLVTLMSRREGAPALGVAAQAAGLEWVWVELGHGGIPPAERDPELAKAVTTVANLVRDGAQVTVHCSAGIHRTGMFTYALLRALGQDAPTARETLARLRAATAEGVGDERIAWAERLCATMGWP